MFLSLLKEEPAEISDMEPNTGRLPLSRPLGGHPSSSSSSSSVVSDSPQIQGVSISPITSSAMQPPGAMVRGDIDPNFEPVHRGRSNTWPLMPEGFLEAEETAVDHNSSGEPPRGIQGIASLTESAGAGGPPKKNTSRRNPWGNMSYADLIAQAIISSPEGRATLSQIYDWMVQNVPYFKDKGDSNSSAGWKNSIRHNLSLHNRFMRMQNEGTGKSSWWVLNPDAKPGKSTRRRANTLEGSRLEKKRGRVRKKVDGLRNSIEAPSSPNLGEVGLEYFPGSPSAGSLHHPFQLSPQQDYRPRASSNASSCGRLSPIPAIESDMHDSQVPPMSPGVVGWGPDYWSANNHAHGSHQSHMGRHVHEPYTEHLVDSIGEGLKLGPPRETWGPHHGLNPLSASSDCLKLSHPHHHLNGFLTQSHNQHPPPNFSSFEDYVGYLPHPSVLHAASNKDKHVGRRSFLPFQLHSLQSLSSTHHSPHNISPTNTMGESPHFSSPPSCDQEMRSTQPFSPPQPHPTTPSTTHNTASTSSTPHPPPPPHHHHHRTSSSSQNSSCSVKSVNTADSCISNPHPEHSESTTMLRVALSHREASCNLNNIHHFKHNGSAQGQHHHHGSGSNDIVDLDTIQGGLECNVEEVIKHELQYEEPLNFDFPQGHSSSSSSSSSYGHPLVYPHREGAGPPMGPTTGPVQVYPCSSIPSGNHWVR